jgi:hypothetical protein
MVGKILDNWAEQAGDGFFEQLAFKRAYEDAYERLNALSPSDDEIEGKQVDPKAIERLNVLYGQVVATEDQDDPRRALSERIDAGEALSKMYDESSKPNLEATFNAVDVLAELDGPSTLQERVTAAERLAGLIEIGERDLDTIVDHVIALEEQAALHEDEGLTLDKLVDAIEQAGSAWDGLDDDDINQAVEGALDESSGGDGGGEGGGEE